MATKTIYEAPRDNPMWLQHLNWMQENEPQRLLQLHRAGELATYLDNKTRQAMLSLARLEQKGVSRDQAYERVMADLIAPVDVLGQENPPEPLDDQTIKQIRNELLA